MRGPLVAVLGLLAAAAPALAQPGPDNPSPPPSRPPAAAPAPSSYGHPWDRSWEAIVLSAAGPPPASAPSPAPEPPPPPANSFWFRVDYLLWWTKDGPLSSPLLTTGPAGAAVIGGLSQPGTQVLFGGTGQDYGTTSGMRFDTGAWLDAERSWGLETDLFFLERRSRGFAIASNAAGSPVLAQPLIDPATGQEFTELIALPTLIAGGTAISTHSRLRGWELNGLANVGRGDHFSFDVLGGLRVASLDEDLQVFSAFSPLVDGFLTFQGADVSPSSTLTTFDGFQAHNHFYGLQLGGRAGWDDGTLAVAGTFKLALGGNQELVQVVGASALTTAGGATTTVPGGVLAVPSNIGRHFRDEFSVIPELGLEVRYRLSNHLEARFGYSFLYWTSVVRPGNQVSRTVEASQVPTDPAFTGAGTQPTFQFHASDYWAQGLNFGLALRY